MKHEAHYHLHINHFGEIIPASVRILIGKHRLFYRKFSIRGSSGELSPLWIVTAKLPTRILMEQLFSETTTATRDDPGMNGYVEWETAPRDGTSRFTEASYRTDFPFPLRRPTFVEAPRAADIHITRSLATQGDALDMLLADVGFYEVISEKERIWTLLMGSRADAKKLYVELKNYFQKTGGVEKIEVEFVEGIEVVTPGFQLLPVAQAGFLETTRSHV